MTLFPRETAVWAARQGLSRQSPTASYPQYGSQGGFGGFSQVCTQVHGQRALAHAYLLRGPCKDMTSRRPQPAHHGSCPSGPWPSHEATPGSCVCLGAPCSKLDAVDSRSHVLQAGHSAGFRE